MRDPLLLDIPTEIATDRLILRAPRPGIGAEVNAAVAESLKELRPWMPWAKTMPTIEESETYARKAAGEFHSRRELPFQGWLKDSQTYVVGSGLHRIHWDVPSFEIGYWVRTSYAGCGYVTETVQALAAMAFNVLSAERVEIRMDTMNGASRRVAERCAFTLEGVLHCDSRRPDGALRDTCVYARVRSAAGG